MLNDNNNDNNNKGETTYFSPTRAAILYVHDRRTKSDRKFPGQLGPPRTPYRLLSVL